MTHMVRKQIYIQKHQQRRLKRLAQVRGVSEAELIRQAIDRETAEGAPRLVAYDHTALEQVIHFALARRNRSGESATGEAYQWKREDAYDE
jgi:hypothetical protein